MTKRLMLLAVLAGAVLIASSQANAQRKSGPSPAPQPPVVTVGCEPPFDYLMNGCWEWWDNQFVGAPPAPEPPPYPPQSLWDDSCDAACWEHVWNEGMEMDFPIENWDMYFPD